MTKTQFSTLRWLADAGGSAVCYRDKICHEEYVKWHATWKHHRGEAPLDGVKKFSMPAVSALHLVQAGCIEASNGRLQITEKGRRHLKP